jgi:natural product precursor
VKKKLTLKKETLKVLSVEELRLVAGGTSNVIFSVNCNSK